MLRRRGEGDVECSYCEEFWRTYAIKDCLGQSYESSFLIPVRKITIQTNLWYDINKLTLNKAFFRWVGVYATWSKNYNFLLRIDKGG
jgi:hypothetical protein